jgi:UDP-N-acetylglucosamine 2-epimerase
MKIVTIVGARPQFIKAAAVNRAIQGFNEKKTCLSGRQGRIHEILIHTGQHYDYLMDKVFSEELELPRPNYRLGVGSGSHAKQTGMMLERIERVLVKEKPEMVIVYGDTNSTLAGALAAAKLNIPVAHIEAGLRSHNQAMPEEINRLLTDHLSTFLFCPTTQSVRNLMKEGIKDASLPNRQGETKVVKRVGDVMYDSILYYSKIAEKKSTILEDLNLINPQSLPVRQAGAIPARPAGGRNPQYYLATLHRAENTDNPDRLKSILTALSKLGKKVPVILPLHPRTKKMMNTYHLFQTNRFIRIIEPVSYLNMLKLEKNASVILTDSGGVQKEAYWFGVPCFTLREETEWMETVRGGWNVLVGIEKNKIVQGIIHLEKKRLSKKGTQYESISTGIFGDGKASEKIIQTLLRK